MDAESLEIFASNNNMFEFATSLNSFADTAALVANADCVVSVDTSVAHLASVLDVPVFILLASVPDWRWGVDGANTMWYKNTQLCRQVKKGDWDSAVNHALDGVSRLLG